MTFRKLLSPKIPYALMIVIVAVVPLWLLDFAAYDGPAGGPPEAAGPAPTAALPLVRPGPEAAPGVTAADLPEPPPPTIQRTLTAGKGDTLGALVTANGVSRRDAHAAITALARHYDPRRLRPGQTVTLIFRQAVDGAEEPVFEELVLTLDAEQEYAVTRTAAGGFNAAEIRKSLARRLTRAAGTIRTSLYDAAIAAKVPLPILMELIRIYSWDVDFQREIRPEDRFEVMFERFYDEDGRLVRDGRVLFGNLVLSGAERPLYRHATENRSPDYFDGQGRSARKALLRTPLNGARLSSGYGRRRHPILGYTKMHRGVDFAARRGTPVYAGGNGTIVYRARNGAYGKYIRIRHNSIYSTAYAHLRRFARKVTKGARVKQGQIIGYVGTTGRSTGPHLHYEILRRGRQTNPLKVRMPSGRTLKGAELTEFRAARTAIDRQFSALPERATVAKRD